MFKHLSLLAVALCFAADQAAAWSLPPDKGMVEPDTVAAILQGGDYPETSDYTEKIDYIDFEAYGQPFTQVVVTLTPAKPRLHDGRKIVVVGGEPGSEYAMDFLETPEDKEGPGVWLAKRGVKFVALTRVGRWNFFDEKGRGSWESIPLEQRMPIFSRHQKAPWTQDDYATKQSDVKQATSGDSAVYRYPKEDSPLYRQMLAATPNTFVEGYRLAVEHAVPESERKDSYLLYWGMSTGGAFLYPLAKYIQPDGYLGWGTSNVGIAYAYRKAKYGDFSNSYSKTAQRLRERGEDDFGYYTKDLDEATRKQWWKGALKGPRFKSGEDMGMQFTPAALTEVALRMWLSDWLPEEDRKRRLGGLIQDVMEPSFPPEALKNVAILDMNGTRDEAIPPKTVDAHREVLEPYAGKYRVARVRDMHHYLFTQDSIKTVGSLWLRFIDSGYFDSVNGKQDK